MNVLLAKNFDVDNLKYSELKVMKSGAKSIYLNYKGAKVNLQTPILNIPYGVNDNTQFINKDEARKDEERKYDITVSFKGMDENPKIQQFHDKMKELEQKIINDAFTNRLVWFKNNYSGNKDVVSNMFTPIVKHDKDKVTGEYANKYPPTFKAKIPYNTAENKFDFDCYDMENNEINFHDVLGNLKGGKAQFIIQLSGIWFSAGMFGCSWKIVSAKFQQLNTSKITFVADSDDELTNVNDEDDDDDISVDNDVIAKISQKQAAASVVHEKKTLVEKHTVSPVVAPVVAPSKSAPKVIPTEEEDEEDDNELDNVEEEGEEEVEQVKVATEEPVKVVPTVQAVQPAPTVQEVQDVKAKKATIKKTK
jgi:hypothetical protein